jgi:hypothetical protein
MRKALALLGTAMVALAIGMCFSTVAHACDPVTGEGCDMGGGGSNPTAPPPAAPSNPGGGFTCQSSGSTTVCSSGGGTTTPTQPTTPNTDSGPTDSGPSVQPGAFTPTASLNGSPPAAGSGTASDAQPVSNKDPGSTAGTDAAAGGIALGGVALAATAAKSPPTKDPSEQDTTEFRWRITSSASYGIAGVTNFEIQPMLPDGSYGHSTYLQYIGIGPSLGAGVSNLSDWERIQSKNAMHFDNSLDGPKFRGIGCQLSLPSIGLGGRGPDALNQSAGSAMGIPGLGGHYVNPDGKSIGANLIGVNVGYWHTIGSP